MDSAPVLPRGSIRSAAVRMEKGPLFCMKSKNSSLSSPSSSLALPPLTFRVWDWVVGGPQVVAHASWPYYGH